MKKLAAILIIVFGILLVLAFTVPSKKDYEEFMLNDEHEGFGMEFETRTGLKPKSRTEILLIPENQQ